MSALLLARALLLLAPPVLPGDSSGEDLPPEPLAEPLAEPLEGIEVPESLLDGVPDNLDDARWQLSPTLADFLDVNCAPIVILCALAAALALGVMLVLHLFRARPNSATPGPFALAAALGCALAYAFGRLLDPVLAALLRRPEWFPADSWTRVGWFEWRLLGRSWAWGALPLADHPGLALMLHLAAWGACWYLLRGLLWLIWGERLKWSEPRRELPFFFHLLGSSTTRKADARFIRWFGPVAVLLPFFHTAAGLRMSEAPTQMPAPGAWVVSGLVVWMLSYHLSVSGRRPNPAAQGAEGEGEAGGEEGDELPAPESAEELAKRAPLLDLREALETLRPGLELETLELRAAREEQRAPFPDSIGPLVREIFTDLTGQTQPWTHQAELLAHFGALWQLRAGAERAEVPTLVEERASAVLSQSQDAPHALMLAPEGAGRTTLTLLTALHVYFDRGATTLVLVRERGAAKRWAQTLERALVGSSARWNVLVCVAGEDLGPTLVAERTPAIVVADLESCESEVLCDARTDDFLARLGLVIADDVDAFTGVAEMHVQLCMRRLWALLDRLHVAAYPVALLATAGGGASGMDAWAKHVLAVPLRLFDQDGAPTRERVLLRRRDLVDGQGRDIPLAVLAEACDLAELPWHLRLAGDAERGVKRAMFDLGRLRRHHREDPRAAAVVIVEGTYPDVRREADRLAHMALALEPEDFPPGAPAVLVLAPPGDEEMVLHEEADDAERRELVASLPRAVTLSEPRVVRQRHFDRAVGREQELRALRERFGARFVDETVLGLGAALRRREVLHIDPLSDEIVPQTLLRAVREGALGQPIDARCVGELSTRALVVDAGTSETLASVDAALARALYPPGSIFMHPRGRFMLIDDHGEGLPVSEASASALELELRAEQIDARERTTADRQVDLQLVSVPQWSDRALGGRKLPVAIAHGQIIESLHGVRRFAPGPTLVDQRIYERPLVVRYSTDVCLIDTLAPGPAPAQPAPAQPDPEPAPPGLSPISREGLLPLVAALRMILPGYMRAAEGLVDVELVALDGRPVLCVFDRTVGGSGFARYVCERGLRELLELGRMVLERCVGPEFSRLRHIHDRALDSDPARWQVGEALGWLDAILDKPPQPEDEALAPVGPRVEFTPGEGVGDLGRLWISQTGRTDDLVWTRHSWRSTVPLGGRLGGPSGGQPKGRVFLDIALERPAIAAAQRRALELASSYVIRTTRLDLQSSEIYETILNAEREALAPILSTLAELCGEHLTDSILALIAAIPLSPRALKMSERGPLAVLARRRADLDAKLLLACAMLPIEADAAVVSGPEGQSWLRVDHGEAHDDPDAGKLSGIKTWALEGPRPVLVEEEPATRATLILDLSEDRMSNESSG